LRSNKIKNSNLKRSFFLFLIFNFVIKFERVQKKDVPKKSFNY
jgi:hypothetical protein